MLSDEEREALDKLSSKKNETTWNDTIRQIKREEIKDVVVTRQKYITTVLNLIEKHSKEIEELKETLKCTQNSWYEDAKIVDKIKAKIEELYKEEKQKLKGTKGQDRYAIKQEYMYKRSGLQSLLEKE